MSQPEDPLSPPPKPGQKQARPDLRIATTDGRPEVAITVKTHEVTAKMCEALRKDPGLYQRSGELVHVIRHEAEGARATGTPGIRTVPLSWLIDRVSMHARCIKKVEDTWKPLPPPQPRVRAVLELGQWSGIRHLEGVIEAPSLRPDGTVIQTPGYDAATRSLYVPNADFPEIPDKPTWQEAEEAYLRLAELFKDFPYVAPEHRSATIAAILTLLARPAILGSVPCWLFDASSPRSGKSLQMDVITLIVTGRKASRMTYPEDDEELEKVLSSYALAGDRIIPFDNIARAFGGAAIDKCITATDTVDLRILGRSEKRTLPWRGVIFGSGNNVYVKGDMLPRVLAPRLESPLENPELRDLPDLRALALERRPQLVADALTILRAFVADGRPAQNVPRWNGFDEWAALVPHALVWVGAPDPMGARRGLAGDEDPTRAAETTLVREWLRLCNNTEPRGLTVSGALAHMYPPPRHDEEPDGWNDLRESLEHLTAARPGSTPASRKVGDALRRIKARPIGGQKLVSEQDRGGIARWRVIPASGG